MTKFIKSDLSCFVCINILKLFYKSQNTSCTSLFNPLLNLLYDFICAFNWNLRLDLWFNSLTNNFWYHVYTFCLSYIHLGHTCNSLISMCCVWFLRILERNRVSNNRLVTKYWFVEVPFPLLSWVFTILICVDTGVLVFLNRQYIDVPNTNNKITEFNISLKRSTYVLMILMEVFKSDWSFILEPFIGAVQRREEI